MVVAFSVRADLAQRDGAAAKLGHSTVDGRNVARQDIGEVHPQETAMPRYLIERTFPEGLQLPANAQGARAVEGVVHNNTRDNVTWIHSYVTPDRRRTFCIYDGPSPEAIRNVAEANGLPVDRITEVRVLDPYFLH
jgi:hypothetical protein